MNGRHPATRNGDAIHVQALQWAAAVGADVDATHGTSSHDGHDGGRAVHGDSFCGHCLGGRSMVDHADHVHARRP